MLCDDCKKRSASVHFTKIVNNQKTEKHLCDVCAKQSGELNVAMDSQLSVQELLKGFFGSALGHKAVVGTELACARCGMTYSDFSRNGKIGCGQCYQAFRERLDPVVRRVHNASGHTGKAPLRVEGKLVAQRKMKALRQILERHVEREEYEEAAQVRDEIRRMEKELNGGKEEGCRHENE